MALTTVDPGLISTSSFKNRIINGAMVIAQRSTGSVTASTTSAITYGSCDRWAYLVSQASKFTYQQSSTAPTGFTNSLLITSSSAYTVGASDTFNILQVIEGFNCADLGFGTANAKTITISFWVQSSLTGTFGGVLCNYNINRTYPFTYTISSANTWEQKTITISGDTTGTWNTNNSGGLQLMFSLGTGSSASGTAGSWSGSSYYGATGATSVVGTSGATFYITGVQLEKGSVATSFDYRPYGTELQLCQRYYQNMQIAGQNSGVGVFRGSSAANATELALNITGAPMRTNPTVTTVTGGSTITVSTLGGSSSSFSFVYNTLVNSNVTGQVVRLRGGGGLTDNAPYIGWNPNADIVAGLSAEL